MIITMEHMSVLDKADEISQMILQSDIVYAYRDATHALQTDEEAQSLIKAFINIKEDYEEVQRFGHYHPDYREIMKKVRSTKRTMDMNAFVASFKRAERDLQRLLDDVSDYIAKSVSDKVMVPKEGLALTDTGCATGGCGTGGSCGCQAS